MKSQYLNNKDVMRWHKDYFMHKYRCGTFKADHAMLSDEQYLLVLAIEEAIEVQNSMSAIEQFYECTDMIGVFQLLQIHYGVSYRKFHTVMGKSDLLTLNFIHAATKYLRNREGVYVEDLLNRYYNLICNIITAMAQQFHVDFFDLMYTAVAMNLAKGCSRDFLYAPLYYSQTMKYMKFKQQHLYEFVSFRMRHSKTFVDTFIKDMKDLFRGGKPW